MCWRFLTIQNAEFVGRTPWSALLIRIKFLHEADGGVGRGPGGPPH